MEDLCDPLQYFEPQRQQNQQQQQQHCRQRPSASLFLASRKKWGIIIKIIIIMLQTGEKTVAVVWRLGCCCCNMFMPHYFHTDFAVRLGLFGLFGSHGCCWSIASLRIGIGVFHSFNRLASGKQKVY